MSPIMVRNPVSPGVALLTMFLASWGCGPAGPGAGGSNNGGSDQVIQWSRAFESDGVKELSGVWGSGPNDVFIVGGAPDLGEVYRFNGSVWRRMSIPGVPHLVRIFGFGPSDVWAVGNEGTVIHYDGIQWTALNSGTRNTLRGVWGLSPEEIWIVGGDADSTVPVLLQYDGSRFESVAAPTTDRDASILFGVWGSDSSVFAVGERGLILQRVNGAWVQVATGPDADEDFVSLSGTGRDNAVAVGGRSSARIAVYDGQTWTTQAMPELPGLSAIFFNSVNEVLIAGAGGYTATFNPDTGVVTAEESGVTVAIQEAWGDQNGRVYAVGGEPTAPFPGIALVRATDAPIPEAVLPDCLTDDDCSGGQVCTEGTCRTALNSVVTIGYLEGESFVPIPDGGTMPLIRGFQGGSHFFATLEFRELPPDTSANINWRVFQTEDSSLLSDGVQPAFLFQTEPGIFRINQLRVAFNTRPASTLNGLEIQLSFALTNVTDGLVILAVTQNVVLRIDDQ